MLLRHPRTSFEAEVVASFSSILKCIDETRSVVIPSVSEELVCFSCDLFRV